MITLEIHLISLIAAVVLVINEIETKKDPSVIESVFSTTNEYPFYVIYAVVSAWSIGLFIFNTGLIIFHIRLCCGQISTFDYIIAKRALRGDGV